MCGIVGAIDRRGNAVLPRDIERASATLRKRGPDDAGIWTGENAGFGHRRLSILDLSPAGHQPMLSPDGRYLIVYNGELYNFRELRGELSSTDDRWRSNSDTEVILAAYAKWGPSCVTRFHGMFAFAVWDTRKRTLFAARDRMGVKPLYYHSSRDRFAFASRPKALFSLYPDLPRAIDEQALRFYLEIGHIPAPFSIHAGIRKLPPAHYLQADRNGIRIERYWDFRHIAPERSWNRRNENDLLDELEEMVSRCVRSRMISDVPIGAFLSGGIDSSLVVSFMTRHSSQPVKTFTIGFDEKAHDESGHARSVADFLGTEHHCEQLRVDDLLRLMPDFLGEYDEPFFDHSAFPVMAVSRLARRHVAVSLSGDGGDELFGGYRHYAIARSLGPLYRAPDKARRALALAVDAVPLHKCGVLAGALRQRDSAASYAFTRCITKNFRGVLSDDILGRTTSIPDLFSDASKAFPPRLDAAEQGMRLDAFYTLPDDYLQKVDVGSMAFSLESRDPLLDQDLVEWAMKLPVRWKVRGGVNKYLFRKLSYRHFPRKLVDRPKQGFGVPIDAWLRGPLKSWAEERLNDTSLFRELPLNQTAALDVWKSYHAGAHNLQSLVWAVLVMLSSWKAQAA